MPCAETCGSFTRSCTLWIRCEKHFNTFNACVVSAGHYSCTCRFRLVVSANTPPVLSQVADAKRSRRALFEGILKLIGRAPQGFCEDLTASLRMSCWRRCLLLVRKRKETETILGVTRASSDVCDRTARQSRDVDT